MSRWVQDVVIAGVSFADCRVELLDGDEFASDIRSSVNVAASGLPRLVAVRLTNGKGRFFGYQMPYAPAALLAEANANIAAAEALLAPFLVQGISALFEINHYCFTDPGQKPFAVGKESESVIENVTYRFVTVGAAP